MHIVINQFATLYYTGNASLCGMEPLIPIPAPQSERLCYDLVAESDLAELFHLYSNEDVARYFGQDCMVDPEQAKFWLAVQYQMREIGLGMTWAMRDLASGALVGTIGFDGINIAWRNVGVSYALHPDFWGRGLATEALTALITLAFGGALGCEMHRIQALVFQDNLPSKRVLDKLGFVHEGCRFGLLYWQERFWDLDSYCLIRPGTRPIELKPYNLLSGS
jgi:ribosomal-protein-alanine N-acetyltransferase